MTNELSPHTPPPTEEVIDLYAELLAHTDLAKVLMVAIAGAYPDHTDFQQALDLEGEKKIRAAHVGMTINGRPVSFRAVMTHLITSYDQCVHEEAVRLLDEKAGNVTRLLDELSEKVRAELGEARSE